MKLSRSKLKQIISEELERVEEIKNDAVQLATMQAVAQGEAVNKSSDTEIIDKIQHAVTALEQLISGLKDGDAKGICTGPLNSFQDALRQIDHSANTNNNPDDDRPSTTPTSWGENEITS
tara:strand:- start:816 stop:1175 length:360 start_codon:yes stop_codon:yes gene_type:complete